MKDLSTPLDPKVFIEQLRKLEEHRAQRLGVNIWLAFAAFAYLFSQLFSSFNSLSLKEIEEFKLLTSHLLIFSVLVFDFFNSIYLKPISLRENVLRTKPYMAGIRDSFLCKTYLFLIGSIVAICLSTVRLSIIICLIHFGFIFVNSFINGVKRALTSLETVVFTKRLFVKLQY